MPVTERYQVDVFAIIILVVAVLILVFLIVVAVYFFNLMNLNPPSRTESTFLFWTTIILGIIFLGIIIYALWRIFTYTVMIYEEPTVMVTPPPTPIQPVITSAPVQPLVVTPVTTQIPTMNLSTNLSDIPLTQRQRESLNQQLIGLSSALNA